MNRPPAFQFFAKDWLSSGTIATMTLEEEGAYIHLLAHCWLTDDCTLPDDDKQLSILSRLNERWFDGAGATLRTCFTKHARRKGRLINRRLLVEWVKLREWIKKSQAAGRKSAEVRRQKGIPMPIRTSKVGSDVVGTNDRTSLQPKSNSSSSSSSSILKTKNMRSDGLNGHRMSFEEFWICYPKKRNKGAAETVWEKLRPDRDLVTVMLAKIEQAKHTTEWQKERGQYIPYPATWLRGKGWEDEFSSPRKERLPL